MNEAAKLRFEIADVVADRIETIVEVAGLPEVETLRILDRAITQGAVSLA